MSKAEELAAKLKQKQERSADSTVSADNAIEHWPGQVYELYHQLEAWLEPLSEAGLHIRRVATRVFETHSSGSTYNYAIDQLVIEGNDKSITFDPIARFTDVGLGRVDIHLKGKDLYLLRTGVEQGDPHWEIHTVPQSGQPKVDPLVLDEDSLLSLIQEGLEL